jgi:hypothetical protein
MMSTRTPLQPPQRPLHRVPTRRLIGASRHDVVEGHGDVGAEGPLDLDGPLGSEHVSAAVYVTLKLHSLVAHPPESVEREHLKPTRVGEQRSVPSHEAMQSAELRDDALSRPDVQVIGVREHQLGARGPQILRRQGTHAPICADGHEDGGLDGPVRKDEPARPCGTIGGLN